MQNTTYSLNALTVLLADNKLYKLGYLFFLLICLVGTNSIVSAAATYVDVTFGSDGKVVSVPKVWN